MLEYPKALNTLFIQVKILIDNRMGNQQVTKLYIYYQIGTSETTRKISNL